MAKSPNKKVTVYPLLEAKLQLEDSEVKSDIFRLLKGKPFWIWDEKEHEKQKIELKGQCCFNHIIGLPEKEHLVGTNSDGTERTETRNHPIYDYEKEVYDALFNYRYIRIKKATGIGMTTFFLRLIIWLCVRNDEYRGKQIGIVTGPRLDLAKQEVEKIVDLLKNTDYYPRKSGERIWINGCQIEAYPSHTFNSARGLENCKFFFVDEADFFPPTQQNTVRTVVERYEAKSHPFVVLTSTTYLPGGLYDQMDKEPNPTFKTIELFYEKGLGKIYTEYEIERAKQKPSFEMEYNGKYGHGLGNIFPYQLLDKCVEEYDLGIKDGGKVLAADPAFGSSKFGIVGIEKLNDIIYVKEALQFERPSPSAMFDLLKIKAEQYGTVVIDDSQPGIITELEGKGISVQGISFRKELSEMTMTASQYVKEKKVRIHPSFSELIYQLKAVEFNEKGHPDKKKLSFDLGDAFLMAVQYHTASEWHWISA